MSSSPLNIHRRPGSISARANDSPSSSVSRSRNRNVSTARLSSPVPSALHDQDDPVRESTEQSMAAISSSRLEHSPVPRSGKSALSSALASSPRPGPGITEGTSPRIRESSIAAGTSRANYGSFDARQQEGSSAPVEDAEIIKRHLVKPDPSTVRFGSPLRPALGLASAKDDDEFSSLQLQGGDVTREVYKWAEEADSQRERYQRSQSFHGLRPPPEDETVNASSIRQPGGFRRNYLRRQAGSPAPSGQISQREGSRDPTRARLQPKLFTNSFLEFLTLYGHFAGEDLEEDDEVLEPDEYFSSDASYGDGGDGGDDAEYGEDSALLTPGGKRKRRPKQRSPTGANSAFNAAMLLLKSFVGTGVLFLPRAFLNGGMLFSSLVLLGVAALSFYCFILLVNTRLVVEASFGDMGGILYGKWMRGFILFSIVLSQLGFVSAYTVFTAENLQAFVLAVSNCRTFIDIKFLVMMQLVIFLPLSLIRDIGKLGFTALIADAFILLGLLYLYYFDIHTIASSEYHLDISLFNQKSWTLFIGTAIFTFEGIGLIIPIQESMRHPEQFPRVLGLVMIVITVLMTSIGALSYAAYGSSTKTVILLNLPQESKLVNTVQLLYSLAIVLSTPLQLFPAIRILETSLFTRSGKYNPYIKWQKNAFRFFLVLVCALIAWGGADDLDKFVSLVGSFACVPLVYVYPPLLHLKAISRTPFRRFADYSVAVFGVVACIYTTGLTIQQWVAGSAAKSPGYCDS